MTLGCCVDRAYGTGCNADTCMALPDGKTCGDCVHAPRCLAFGFTSDREQTSCSFFPRRFRLRHGPDGEPMTRPASDAQAAGVATGQPRPCNEFSPPWFSGRWRDWHRGHGCDLDDGKPRSAEGAAEIAAGGKRQP